MYLTDQLKRLLLYQNRKFDALYNVSFFSGQNFRPIIAIRLGIFEKHIPYEPICTQNSWQYSLVCVVFDI